MKHLVSALPRMALLAAAFVAVTAIWGAGTDPTRAEEHDRPGDRGPLSYAMSLAQPGQLPDADMPIAAGINELDGDRYTATLIGGEMVVWFHERESAGPAWWAAVPAPELSAGGQLPPLLPIMQAIYSIEDGQKTLNAFAEQARGDTQRLMYARPLADLGQRPNPDAPIVAGINDPNGNRYAATLMSGEMVVQFHEPGSAGPAWWAAVPAPELSASGQSLPLFPIMQAIYSIEDEQKISSSPQLAAPRRAGGQTDERPGGEPAGTMSSPIIGTSSAGSFGAFNNHGRPQVIVSGNSGDGAAVSVIELQDGHGRRYTLEASGNLLKTRYFEADAAEAAWSATAPLPEFAAESGSLWGNNLEIAELLRAAFSIEERERVYGGGADAAEGDNGDWIPATVIEFREGYLTFAEENGRYWARLRADEAVITFYESGSSQPAWTAAVPLDDGSDAGALAGVPANMPGAEMLLRAIVANLTDDAKVFHDADTRTYEYVRPMALVPASVRLTMSGATVVVDAASPAGAVIYARFTADLENEYVATVRGTEVEVRFYPRGAGRHAWSAIVQLNEPLESTDPSLALAPTLIAAIRSITLADLQPPAASGADWSDGAGASAARIGESERTNDGNAAVIAAPDAEQSQAPRQAAPDEGGTGVNNFDREEWYEFSILLAPFLVLVTFILILMFRWDRGSKEE